jgi:hypothetical protein
LIGQSCIGAAIANAVINGALGWGATRELAVFPVWHVPGVAADIAGTAFGVTFGTCVFMALQVPFDVRRGKLSEVPLSPGVASLLARFPRSMLTRGLGLGLLSVPLFAAPLIAALAVIGADSMQSKQYVMLKAVFAAVEGAVITPFLVLAALDDVIRKRGALAT